MSAATCRLAIKAIPNASRDEVVGWLGDALKVKLRAPALEGRANEALLDLLAAWLSLPRRAITLVRGEKSRQKIVEIAGMTIEALNERVKASLPSALG